MVEPLLSPWGGGRGCPLVLLFGKEWFGPLCLHTCSGFLWQSREYTNGATMQLNQRKRLLSGSGLPIWQAWITEELWGLGCFEALLLRSGFVVGADPSHTVTTGPDPNGRVQNGFTCKQQCSIDPPDLRVMQVRKNQPEEAYGRAPECHIFGFRDLGLNVSNSDKITEAIRSH